MTRPDSLTVNGHVVVGHMTSRDKDIYELGEAAGHAKLLATMRGKVAKQLGALREMSDIEYLTEYAEGQMQAYGHVMNMIDGAA